MKTTPGWFRSVAGLCGVAGPIILVGSFRMNPAPPSGMGPAALAAWAAPHEGLILLGGWAQGIGSLLIVIFALAVAELGGDASPFGRRLTMLAGATILMVSLMEIAFYLAAARAIATKDVLLGMVADGLIRAVQHVFLIAPALLLPLGVVILKSGVLPSAFGYAALAFGATLQALGLAGLIWNLQGVVDVVLIAQSVWFVLAGATLVLREGEVAADTGP
ncbi:MAG TPA: hypothetical protein VGG92_16735 [Caulobacteraceae bacterium]